MNNKSIQFNIDEQRELISLAKSVIKNYLKNGTVLELAQINPKFNQVAGAFVTLKNNQQLRGCIGIFESDLPLYQVIIEMAIAAATEDNRFLPITIDELNNIEIEISVLSPLTKINSWQEIELGKHGVQIVSGYNRGVFLPQVAIENNWDLETFMDFLCVEKAGLPIEAWKDGSADLYIFTAQVISE